MGQEVDEQVDECGQGEEDCDWRRADEEPAGYGHIYFDDVSEGWEQLAAHPAEDILEALQLVAAEEQGQQAQDRQDEVEHVGNGGDVCGDELSHQDHPVFLLEHFGGG